MFITGIKLITGLVCALSLGQKNATSNTTTSNRKFVEDIRTIYANNVSDAKAQLPDGYQLANESAVYENGDGRGNTYLAIKPTDNVKNAITDIRAMNMVGGWSTSSYEDILESQTSSIQVIINNIKPAIIDFRSKYEEGKQKALNGEDNGVSFAALLLDSIYDDDIVDSEGIPYTILDIFMDTSLCSDKTLQTIFMEGNTSALHSIEAALMYSSSALNDEDEGFDLERLCDYYSDFEDCIGCDYDNPISSTETDQMIASLNGLKDVLAPFINSGFAAKPDSFTEEHIKEYMNCLTQDQAAEFQASARIYSVLAAFDYTYLGDSLINFFANFDSESDTFTSDMVKPLYLEMTDAQRAIVPYAGFDSLLQALINEGSEFTDENDEKVPQYKVFTEVLDENLESLETKVSVFENVDRRIFNAKGIALTSDALRQNSAKNDFDWYVTEGNDTTELLSKIVQLSCLVGASLVVACALTYFGMKAVMLIAWGPWKYFTVFSQGTFSQALKFWVSEGKDMALVAKKSTPKLTTEMERVWASKAKAKSVYKRQFSYAQTSRIDYEAVARSASNMTKVMTAIRVAFVVANIAFAVAMIIFFVKKAIAYDTEYIEYADIPEMMSDERTVNDDAAYFYYTNVKTFDNKTADVTQASSRKHSQWTALYYSTDPDCGNPIYADSFEYKNSIDDTLDKTGVTKFGEKGIYNVQKYVEKNGSKSKYIYYESVDMLTNAIVQSSSLLQTYAKNLMGDVLGKSKSIIEEYSKKFEICTSINTLDDLFLEAMNLLNKEKSDNYDVAYPIYQRINALDLNNPDEKEVNTLLNEYIKLTDDQKTYIENYEILLQASQKVSDNTITAKKTETCTEITNYIDNLAGLGSADEKEALKKECLEEINKAESLEAIEQAKQNCYSKITKAVDANRNKAGSTFGNGNLGLLFIGLVGGIAIGSVGLWLILRLIKKKKESATE